LLHSRRLFEEHWETILPEALHAVRSLVCLSTNNASYGFSGRAMTALLS